ncbi:MAG: DUF1003 domain-containing protein [Deltaproteobacteria bacterium]
MTEVKCGPAAEYKHDHPPVTNVNQAFDAITTVGQRAADKVTNTVGSWKFIIFQSIILILWMILNVVLAFHQAHLHGLRISAWDPYPFILLNLVLSFQAAYTGPIVMMSQNRQADKDRLAAEHDFEVNMKAEKEIEIIMKHLAHQDELIIAIQKQLESKRYINE